MSRCRRLPKWKTFYLLLISINAVIRLFVLMPTSNADLVIGGKHLVINSWNLAAAVRSNVLTQLIDANVSECAPYAFLWCRDALTSRSELLLLVIAELITVTHRQWASIWKQVIPTSLFP